MDPLRYPYPSRRHVLMGPEGAVATSQPLAASAGLTMLQRGGSAVDAAVAMAAALVVVEPTSNGLGSDAFAIVSDGERLHGLNASGPSPAGLDPAPWFEAGRVPRRGWGPVTVPGAVAAWAELHARWGRLDWSELLAPAIRYAEEGFPVSPVTARAWARAARVYAEEDDAASAYFREVFFPGGRAPRPGERWRNPDLAASLRRIAEEGAAWLYRGGFAEALEAFARASGGAMRAGDLAAFAPEWVEPMRLDYAGLEVYELPPNGQGVAALLALAILRELPLAEQPREAVEAYHLQIEAMKLAFAETQAHVADPRSMRVEPRALLAPGLVRALAARVGDEALEAPESQLPAGGTVYLAAARRGASVSFIQSNYMGFGAGVAVPGTGAALQNRGAGFVADPAHPNAAAPGKRPYHTIIPGFLGQNGRPLGPFGLMGGFMQPQGHVQLVVNMTIYGMNPQAALDAPRWQVHESGEVWLEPGVPADVAQGLVERGHRVHVVPDPSAFGRGQVLLRRDGVWWAASEPRADGQAQVF
ncbi:gamma-glutamyltransferase family protein [Oceanithermus sp.]|uniref:gamma-glutamyltransferase family protein n=1 Tax=Oceanithermus sp. TaxID=2268145 RepID=UPI0025E1AC15|nr:gamma-glutamyltransferase family protein [Oceanithermus sp.]